MHPWPISSWIRLPEPSLLRLRWPIGFRRSRKSRNRGSFSTNLAGTSISHIEWAMATAFPCCLTLTESRRNPPDPVHRPCGERELSELSKRHQTYSADDYVLNRRHNPSFRSFRQVKQLHQLAYLLGFLDVVCRQT